MFQGAAWAFAAQVLVIVSGVASQVFLARLIPPEALGAFFLAQSLVIMTANVGEFGLARPVARLISVEIGADRVGQAFRVLRSAAGITGVSGCIVVIVFLAGLGRWLALHVFDSTLMANSMGLVSLWIAARIVLSFAAAVLQGMHRVGLSALLTGSFTGTVLAVVCGILLWRQVQVEFGTIIAISTAATLVGAMLAVAAVWIPFSRVRPSGSSPTRALLSSTIPIFAAGILQMASLQVDLWIVGFLLDASDVALYGAAKRLMVLVGFPLIVLAIVVPPMISDLYARGESERLERLIRAATTAASLPAAALFAVFLFFGSEVLALAYGDVYAEAGTIVRILCAERLFLILLGPGSLLLVMTGHEQDVFRITMVSATMSLGAIYVGGLLGGSLGVALGYTLSSSATGLWYFFEARRRTGIWAYVSPPALRSMMEVVQSMARPRT